MTNKVHDTSASHVSSFKEVGSFTDNILSNETVDPYLKIHLKVAQDLDHNILLVDLQDFFQI